MDSMKFHMQGWGIAMLNTYGTLRGWFDDGIVALGASIYLYGRKRWARRGEHWDCRRDGLDRYDDGPLVRALRTGELPVQGYAPPIKYTGRMSVDGGVEFREDKSPPEVIAVKVCPHEVADR